MKDNTESVELNKSLSKEYDIPCPRCLVETTHKVLTSADITGYVNSLAIHYWEEFQIVQCQGCKSVSFRKNHTDTDDIDHIERPNGKIEDVLVDHVELYPIRIAGRNKLKRHWLLPFQVSKCYEETHSALANKLTILAGIGMGVLIEAVCSEKQAKGGNLKEKIDDLVATGTLSKAGGNILHTLRDLRNESAHDIKPQSEDTLDTAMDVIENLLQTVYILPRIAETLGEEPF